MIMNTFMFNAAIILMLIIIVREVLRKKYNIDMDKIDVKNLKNIKSQIRQANPTAISRGTGSKNIVLKDTGANKATVMATLRQITDMDYNTAKSLVENVPSTILTDVSEQEANLTKKALEFVGATVEIK